LIEEFIWGRFYVIKNEKFGKINNITNNGELLLARLAPFLCCIMEGCVAKEVLLVDNLVQLAGQATIRGRKQEGKAGLVSTSIEMSVNKKFILLMIWISKLA
jgi:hypothetical protein